MSDKTADIAPKKPPIRIEGARLHNLKNVSVSIPRNKLVVITGLSGSGKSSLAFDTLYAEGQRRYVESLSSYARQFLGRLNKPKVDHIRGIAPAIAIEQKVNATNPRSTVGTSTEIYDYLKLLYTRIGKTYSPVSGKEVKKDRTSDVIDYVEKLGDGEKLLLMAPIHLEEGRTLDNKLKTLAQQGYARIKVGDKVSRIDEHDIETALEPADRAAGVAGNYLEVVRPETLRLGNQPGNCAALLFQRNDMRRAPGERLESERPATRETIEYAGATTHRREPVEQGFANAIGRGS